VPITDLQDAKRQVYYTINIVELVEKYTDVKYVDEKGYFAICPWHNDCRYSLKLNPERRSFWCPTCQFGGDIFSFTMLTEGVSPREALEMLAGLAGIELSLSDHPSKPPTA
jgi:DNA primase